MPNITMSRAKALIDEAVATQGPNFVYNKTRGHGTCVNVPITDQILEEVCAEQPVPEDDPRRLTGCLVGTAMKLSGVDMDVIITGSASVFYSEFADGEGYTANDVAAYLNAVQFAQDDGCPWGLAAKYGEYVLTADDKLYSYPEKLINFIISDGDGWDLSYLESGFAKDVEQAKKEKAEKEAANA